MSVDRYGIVSCKHNYRTIEVIEGEDRLLIHFFRKINVRCYILECKKCGRISQRTIYLPEKIIIKMEDV